MVGVNPTLHQDVTDRCESERLWVPIDDDKCAESQHCIDLENATTIDWKTDTTPLENMPNPPLPYSLRTCFSCPRADVIIGGFTQKNRRLRGTRRRGRRRLDRHETVGAEWRRRAGQVEYAHAAHTHTHALLLSFLFLFALADARVPPLSSPPALSTQNSLRRPRF